MSIKHSVRVSFLAGFTVLLTFVTVYFVADVLEYGIILASLGATAFLVFVYPERDASRSKIIVGGYFVSSFSGALSHWLLSDFLPWAAALSVGLSIFLMLLLGLEHPPASGIGLSFSLYSLSFQEVVSVMVGMVVFLALTAFFKRIIKRIPEMASSIQTPKG
ncbi:hypothetical protein GWN63_01605 [Candidatus Bathyarchaeota archaeon]|nr:HPP family protein [Candidatus Bathyarchaeota archaeon]NIU80932.1 hypothetical protein [Candidatus Bathyarchaeota archaeon]NIV67588.1 hypothetical protein [Candidatus Bathyarchaeota archaeon]NIW16111.1 hypothetical protein [Candidatus Bathyarchaeota archaeon]NIW34217.1 hypothetical protein [Candidatus Bathyarchaeota archaeon]